MIALAPSKLDRAALGSGVALIVAGLTADLIGVSSEPGFGGLQLGLIGLGAAIACWGSLGSRRSAQRSLSRVFMVVGSLYFALWLVELLLSYPLNPRRAHKPHALSMQGFCEKGDQVAVRHVPRWSGVFDDGVLQIPIAINSHGDRDDEPGEHPVDERILLIGDSFTFGQGLTDEQTIDHRIEAQSDGALDAYNLGVMGYGPSDSYLRFSESSWWTGRAVYYLFYENDLQDQNSRPDVNTVHDGYVVPRLKPDGKPYTPEEWTQRLANVAEYHATGKNQLRRTLTLPTLQQIAYQVTHRNARLSGMAEHTVKPEYIESAIDYTNKMKVLAEERGATFTVVVLPTMFEAVAGEYSDWATSYLEAIRAQGIEVVELLPRLDGDDYFPHDPHFNPSGAEIAADTIRQHFQGRESG